MSITTAMQPSTTPNRLLSSARHQPYKKPAPSTPSSTFRQITDRMVCMSPSQSQSPCAMLMDEDETDQDNDSIHQNVITVQDLESATAGPLNQPPTAQSTQKPKRIPIKPEVVEQLSCLAANVTLRLVGTRWRLVMQQQQQQQQQQQPANLTTTVFQRSLSNCSTTTLGSPVPNQFTSPSCASPIPNRASPALYRTQSSNSLPVTAVTPIPYLSVPHQPHLHPLTPPQSPLRSGSHQEPSESHLIPPPYLNRTTSTTDSLHSTNSTLRSDSLPIPPSQQPLPTTYLFHYASRLPLMMADAALRDATLPTAAWLTIANQVDGIPGIVDRKSVADLKMGALVSLDYNINIPEREFEGWLEKLKGWVAASSTSVTKPPASPLKQTSLTMPNVNVPVIVTTGHGMPSPLVFEGKVGTLCGGQPKFDIPVVSVMGCDS
ncbi:hypothetical protein BC829DRAFT_490969 [Chytridium lagenaria]|nr:hypothetical protein BC829DRAFT_490969 [Chytridium lagenaria]